MFQMPGFRYLPGYYDEKEQRRLVETIVLVIARAPFFRPTMPRTGNPLSVQMSNCGPLGWVSDKDGGYRYQSTHPVTGEPWPDIPDFALDLWADIAGFDAQPEACLINWYAGKAKMGMHKDQDEDEFSAPVISISLGDRARFRLGGHKRKDVSQTMDLSSGDVVVLGGDARLAYHGIDRIYPDTSDMLPQGGRLNLTLRRVTNI